MFLTDKQTNKRTDEQMALSHKDKKSLKISKIKIMKMVISIN